MKESIQSLWDNPNLLEKYYRKNKSEFRQEFSLLYPQMKGQPAAEFWHERLNFDSDRISWGSQAEWKFVVIAALLAGILAKFPAFFSIDEEFFYPRNLGFIAFPFVTAYFAWKNQLSINSLVLPVGVMLVSALYINLLPENQESDTFILACIHLPLLLWGLLGFVFSAAKIRDLSRRLAYLNFNGDAVIMGALLLLAGGLMSGITIGLFSLIGLQIEKFYFEYIVVFGLASAPLVATHLTQTNPQLVNKVPPIIAKIFSPLVLIMLVIYLGAIVYAGKDPYNDREFLMIFNMLLIGVMALIFFSVAESSKDEKSGPGIWILVLLSLITIVVNGVALSAIAFRIAEWGITPNRMAVLGVNLLMLIHLLLVAKKLIQTALKNAQPDQVGITLVKYLPIYLIWTAIVVFLFPVIFGFE
ncbi:protein of unknown function [Algoriphagus alkaliphilus]|uniref:DUF4153 domain-containing protein n=1 Tax=Algoriphagus alkaliphilus TaxID=279824 RepID=A0A1G5Z2C4_9BACT|nr:DUF4153 domain-containing protein [Algoriphagus alkaliphilus]SDA88692.1 protein of unknown function [Algoriphagus alkaliphilus]